MTQPSKESQAPVRKKSTLSPFYWVHCNKCYELHIKRRKRILLLSCQHMACVNCAKEHLGDGPQASTTNYTCPICAKVVRGRPLSNLMPQHIKELFNPQYWRDEIFSVRVFHFQLKQRKKFIEGFILPLLKHYERLKQKEQILNNRTKKTFEEFEVVRMKRKQIEARAKRVIAERIEREKAQASSSMSTNTTFSHPAAHSTLIDFKNTTTDQMSSTQISKPNKLSDNMPKLTQ